MKEKIKKLLKYIEKLNLLTLAKTFAVHSIIMLIWMILIPFIILITFTNSSMATYFSLIVIYIGMGSQMWYLAYFRKIYHYKKTKTIYNWLDNQTNINIAKEIIGDNYEVKGNTLYKLEVVQRKILRYTKNDMNKLILLKSYLRSMNTSNQSSLILKIILPILGTLFITLLTSDNALINFLFSDSNNLERVNDQIINVINFTFIILMVLLALLVFLKELNEGNMRIALLEELVESCIQKLREDRTH